MPRASLAFLIGLLVLWQWLASAGLLPRYLTSPAVIAREFALLLQTGELFQHSAVSLYRSLAGLALGAGLGIGTGLVAGTSRRVAGFFEPLVSLTYPVPKVALLPILLVWFGISDTSKILLIAVSCFYPCYIAALYGVRAVDPIWIWASQNMGASPRQVFFKVIVPAAGVHIFGGLRVSLALALILMVASELIGSSNRLGLGFLIINADAGGRFDIMFAAIVAIAILGFAADRLLLGLRKRWLAGYAVMEESAHA
jgi:ABC-type nitrate/sulfonate/bicarbonate transport system permease component